MLALTQNYILRRIFKSNFRVRSNTRKAYMRLTMQIGIRFAGLNIFYAHASVEQIRSGGRENERPWG